MKGREKTKHYVYLDPLMEFKGDLRFELGLGKEKL